MTTTKTSVIDEIREITANEVAKKQDSAKNNFLKLIEKIKQAAGRAESEAYFCQHEINEFDKRLLEQEGFRVWLVDDKLPDWANVYAQREKRKVWKVSW